MFLKLDNDNMVKSDNFSNVYDLLLNDKKQKKLNPVLSKNNFPFFVYIELHKLKTDFLSKYKKVV